MPIFIVLSGPLMGPSRPDAAPRLERWTIERAEELLCSLTGVLSARVVAKAGGEIEEIHLLTTDEVSPKQTVRNVESALLAQLDLEVDHRKISVAQTSEGRPAPAPVRRPEPEPEPEPVVLSALATESNGPQGRILFVGHSAESERSARVTMKVALEWRGERYEGKASGADMPRTRLDAVATATLRAVEATVERQVSLTLDGVKLIDAFDRRYVLVGVHALAGRDMTALAGAANVEDTPDRAVIMATLQATDRWVRGQC